MTAWNVIAAIGVLVLLFAFAMWALAWADQNSGPQWNETDDEAAEEDRRRLR